MKTFYINPVTMDIEFDGQNSLKMISEDEKILQDINILITTNTNEWFLNPLMGFSRFEILGNKFDAEKAANELYSVILQHEEVETIENVDIVKDGRRLIINYTFIKKTGEPLEGVAIV